MSRFFRRKASAPASGAAPHGVGPGHLETEPEAEQLPRALLPPPSKPKLRVALVQSSDRPDTTALANGIVRAAAQARSSSSGGTAGVGPGGGVGREDREEGQLAAAGAEASGGGCAVHVLTWRPDGDEVAQAAVAERLLSDGYDAVVRRATCRAARGRREVAKQPCQKNVQP